MIYKMNSTKITEDVDPTVANDESALDEIKFSTAGLTKLEIINQAITSETQAIREYQNMLAMIQDFTESEIEIINEIMDDEKDHLALLTAMLDDETTQELPDYGDE